jgi:hypothetical protein
VHALAIPGHVAATGRLTVCPLTNSRLMVKESCSQAVETVVVPCNFLGPLILSNSTNIIGNRTLFSEQKQFWSAV